MDNLEALPNTLLLSMIRLLVNETLRLNDKTKTSQDYLVLNLAHVMLIPHIMLFSLLSMFWFKTSTILD